MFDIGLAARARFLLQPEDERRRLGRRCGRRMRSSCRCVGSRGDLNYLIGEMLGELSNSHTYVGGGDDCRAEQSGADRLPRRRLRAGPAPRAATALAKIYPGDNTREDYRRAADRNRALDVHEGDYLLAVDGVAVAGADRSRTACWSVSRTHRDADRGRDVPDGKRRDVTVQPVQDELPLREKAWIDHNREVVDKASGGRIGYIYLSDMEELGMDQFIRQFYPQLDKQALIVDERWNGGGFIDQILLERLRRILVGMATNREGAAKPIPQQLHQWAEGLPDEPLFGLGRRHLSVSTSASTGWVRCIGTRTWGGVRGIRGYWALLDGGYVTIPEDTLYGLRLAVGDREPRRRSRHRGRRFAGRLACGATTCSSRRRSTTCWRAEEEPGACRRRRRRCRPTRRPAAERVATQVVGSRTDGRTRGRPREFR